MSDFKHVNCFVGHKLFRFVLPKTTDYFLPKNNRSFIQFQGVNFSRNQGVNLKWPTGLSFFWREGVNLRGFSNTGALIVNNAINAYLFPNDDKKRVNFLNPSKGDWFKFKIGTVVLDPTSGMNTSVRFATTLAMMPFEDEKYVRSNNQGDNRKNAIARRTIQYGLGKLSPGYTTIAEYVLKHDYNGNTLPFSDDKPYYKHNRKLDWLEYGSQKLPLPIAEGTEIYNEAAHETGVNKKSWELYMKGIGYGALSGLTGIRAYENSQAVNNTAKTEGH